MKNTLILNVTSSIAKLEHISNVADGTDRLILEIKNGGGDSIHIVNPLGSFDVTTTSELDYIEVPRCYWTGLGTESVYIYKDDSLVYTIAINKIQVCGGSYQLEKLSEDTETDTLTIGFGKVNKIKTDIIRTGNTQVIGTWTNGKPIYRTILGDGRRSHITQPMDISALCLDHLIALDALCADGSVEYYTDAPKKWRMSSVSGMSSRQIWLNDKTVNCTASNFTFSFYYIILEYTRKTDPEREITYDTEDDELRDEFTLVWEGDMAADGQVTLPESMMLHKELMVELRNNAATTNGQSMFYRIPTKIFKEYCRNNTTPTNRWWLSPYDNQQCSLYYIDDVSFYFDFNTTSRLRRVWFVD